jgi:hypothetical protein
MFTADAMGIGRGLMTAQHTSAAAGRGNYAALGGKVGLDLLNSLNWSMAWECARKCGVADLLICSCLPFAQADDVSGVTQHLNGGVTGLDERTHWLARWKIGLASLNPGLHSTAWLQLSLNKLGADPLLSLTVHTATDHGCRKAFPGIARCGGRRKSEPCDFRDD